MALLVAFAFLAGAGTAISPCVLPVLPALLSAGATGGRRRPLGIVLGLAITFTITIVGLPASSTASGSARRARGRWRSSCSPGSASCTLVPALGDRLEARLSRARALRARARRGDGFWSGVGVGGALGFVYAPCAGPILAAVITVGSASGRRRIARRRSPTPRARRSCCSRSRSAAARSSDRIRARRARPGAAARARRRDARDGARDGARPRRALPDGDRQPPARRRSSTRRSVARGLRARRARARRPARAVRASTTPKDDMAGEPRVARRQAVDLPELGQAPDFTGNQRWFNTPGGRALTLARPARPRRARRLLDLHLHQLHAHAARRSRPGTRATASAGLTIVGVHTPEFAFEKDAGNVAAAIRQNRLRYPVAQDNDLRDLERLGQPVLAREVPDRRARQGPLHALRRGRGRRDRGRDPLAAGRDAATPLGAPARRDAQLRPRRRRRRPRPISAPRARRAVAPGGPRRRRARVPAGAAAAAAEPLRALRHAGGSAHEARPPARGAAISVRFQAKDVYLVLSPPPARRGGCACCSTAARSAARRAPTRTAGRCGTASACTSSCTCPRVGRHRLELRSRPASRATRSRSAERSQPPDAAALRRPPDRRLVHVAQDVRLDLQRQRPSASTCSISARRGVEALEQPERRRLVARAERLQAPVGAR